MNEYPNPIEVITKTILWLAAVLVISTFIGFTIGLPVALLLKTISR
jgi:hypothetical protein